MTDYRLFCGDCLEIMPTLEAGSVDAIITDLPYGTTACEWDSIIPLESLWQEYERLLEPRGAIVLTASQPFTGILVASRPAWFKCEWIWEKPRITGYLDAKRKPMKAHESVLVFGRPGRSVTYNPQMSKGPMHKSGAKPEWGGQAKVYAAHKRVLTQSNLWYPRSIVRFASDPETTVTKKHRPGKMERHPTQKSLALIEYFVLTYSNPGDVIMDNTMGSGTTGEAAIRTGRKFIGIEQERKYFRIAERRVKQAQPPLFHETGLTPRAGDGATDSLVQASLEDPPRA